MTAEDRRTRRLRELQGELETVQAFLQEHPGYSTAVANAQLLLERMRKQISAVLDTEGDRQEPPDWLLTECCGVLLNPVYRYCPKCGHECRAVAEGHVPSPQEKA